jgi:hypothetical protein
MDPEVMAQFCSYDLLEAIFQKKLDVVPITQDQKVEVMNSVIDEIDEYIKWKLRFEANRILEAERDQRSLETYHPDTDF